MQIEGRTFMLAWKSYAEVQLILFKDKEIPPKESEWTNYFHVEAFYLKLKHLTPYSMENEKNIVAIQLHRMGLSLWKAILNW